MTGSSVVRAWAMFVVTEISVKRGEMVNYITRDLKFRSKVRKSVFLAYFQLLKYFGIIICVHLKSLFFANGRILSALRPKTGQIT